MKRYLLVYNDGNAGGNDNTDKNGDKDAKTTFTQDDVNRLLAEDRRKHQAQAKKYVEELENLKKITSLSDKERQSLQTKIDELNSSLMTKEQLALAEKQKLEKQHKEMLDTLTQERDIWSTRFTQSQIQSAIISAASAEKAFNHEPIYAMLRDNTRLVQEVDADGKPTENFVPKVKFLDKDKDGKPVTLDLTVAQAVKKMKESAQYGFLFENPATAGVGGQRNNERDAKLKFEDMNFEQYKAWREKNLKG